MREFAITVIVIILLYMLRSSSLQKPTNNDREPRKKFSEYDDN